MKVGDLVRYIPNFGDPMQPGVITGFAVGGYVVVFWNEKLFHEKEYPCDLEVINASR
jgi:hypothetical protein